jgi:hypothetical protein
MPDRNPTTTLDFSLVFRWFSAFFPTLCTVLSKKTKLSCFFKSKQLLGFLYLNVIKVEYSKKDIQTCQ